jgi:hypothetical protein
MTIYTFMSGDSFLTARQHLTGMKRLIKILARIQGSLKSINNKFTNKGKYGCFTMISRLKNFNN